MKNKKAIFIVLPATIFVWVIAFMQIYKRIHPDNDEAVISRNTIGETINNNTVRDTFQLNLNYRDPFSIKSIQQLNEFVNTAKTPQKPKPVTIEKTAKNWPVIIYSGMIKNQKSNKQLALVQINGNLRTLKTGDESDDILIGRIYKDSIEVSFAKQKKFIHK